ncbi:MAG: thioredoxin family protein [Candidatus Bathyarchaeia archaeon]
MSKIVNLQADSWDEDVIEAEEEAVVVDFWHDMCSWCLRLNPIFEQLPDHFDNVRFFKFNVMDSNDNRELALNQGVMGTPTIKIFCNGRGVGEIVGFRNLETLIEEIRRIIDDKEICLKQSTPL